MAPAAPVVRFEAGQCLRRLLPGRHSRRLVDWVSFEVIGRVDGVLFLLHHREPAATSWWSAAPLTEPARRRVLAHLRAEVVLARTMPGWLAVHDLRAVDMIDGVAGMARSAELSSAFFNDVWRGRYVAAAGAASA